MSRGFRKRDGGCENRCPGPGDELDAVGGEAEARDGVAVVRQHLGERTKDGGGIGLPGNSKMVQEG